MAAILHLLKGADASLARAVLDRQLREGDRVTVVPASRCAGSTAI